MEARPSARGSATRRLRERYGLLLAAIILTFAVQGIATPSAAEQIAVCVLLGVTLLLALWATNTKPRVMRPATIFVALVRDRQRGAGAQRRNR